MAAKTVAALKTSGSSVTVESYCFKTVTYSMNQVNNNTFEFVIEAHHKLTLTCSDLHLLSSGDHFHMGIIALPGVHKFTFQNLGEDDINYISKVGLHAFRFCDSVAHLIPNIFWTASLFLGGLGTNPMIPFFGSKPPQYMQKLNVEFIKQATGYQWTKNKGQYIDLDEKYIRSGDYFAITRMDGLDQIIEYGTGSHSGHSTMALWDHESTPPQLYVVES